VESVVSTSQTRGEEFKVKLQFDSPGSINPLKLTKVLHDAVGTVDIKPLRDGSLMITCSDAKQRNDMIKMTNLGGKEIKCFVWGQKKTVQGVITGISTELTTEEILENVSGAKVVKARRLLYLKNGTKQESLSILLQFQEEMLPTRVKVGFMSFQVRPYVPPPLRCFKCQRFGHVAAICRGSGVENVEEKIMNTANVMKVQKTNAATVGVNIVLCIKDVRHINEQRMCRESELKER